MKIFNEKGRYCFSTISIYKFERSEKRPSVVLYSGKFDLIVAFITSKLKSIEDLDVSLQPNRQNRLKETSVLKTNKLASIEKELIIGKIGELSEFQMKNLDIKLKQVFKLN